MDFKDGDVVQLKSGGPKMTVRQCPFKTSEGVEYPDRAECTWFNDENHLKHSVFNVADLKKL